MNTATMAKERLGGYPDAVYVGRQSRYVAFSGVLSGGAGNKASLEGASRALCEKFSRIWAQQAKRTPVSAHIGSHHPVNEVG